MPDMLFILMLAMIILGPKKLPQVAAQVAKIPGAVSADEA